MDGTAHSQGETAVHLPDMLATGLIAAALFLPMFFQDIRLEGYETEKAGVLLIFATPLLVLLPFVIRRVHLKSPLVWAVLALLGVSAVSTLTSISPHTSLEGLPNRGQGLLTYLAYGALFFGAVGVGRRLIPLITPILIAVAVPLCLYALYQRFDVNNPRPGSLLGNANFFASWLILALIWLGSQFWRYLGGTRYRSVAQWMVFTTMLLIGVALLLTGSRGALAALAGGAFASGLVYTASTGRKRLALGLFAAVAMAALAYGAISLFVPEDQLSGGLRIFRPVDPFRLDAWEAGKTTAESMTAPLFDAFSRRDPLVNWRPLIGYGLDTVPFLQARYGVVSSPAYYIDTFHNLGYDALVWTGQIGLAVWIAIYVLAAFLIFLRLQLVRRNWVIVWSLFHLLVSGLIAIGIMLLLPNESAVYDGLILVGAMLGLVLASLLWIFLITLFRLRAQTNALLAFTPDQSTVIGIAGVLIAGCIDLQFGFMTVSAGSLWWISLGLLVASGVGETRAIRRIAPTGDVWLRAVASAGVILIAGIGMTMHSQYVQHEVGSSTLLILLAVLLAIGSTIPFALDSDIRRAALKGAFVVGVWIVWGVIEAGISSLAGSRADAALTDNVSPFGASLNILALKGIGAAVLVILIWLPLDALRQRFRAASFILVPIALLAIGGAAIYANQFRISTQTAIGNTFAGLGDPAAYPIALRLYDEMPNVPQAQFEALSARLRWETSPYVFNTDTERLLANEPYISGTRTWTLFYNNFVAQFRQPPAYSLNVIRAGTFDGDNPRQYWTPYADANMNIQRSSGWLTFADTGDQPDIRAAVYQDVEMDAAAGTRFDIRLDLRNPGAEAVQVQVLLNPPDFSESPFCVFTLPPRGTWQSYSMSASSVSAWENIRFALYSADGETADERIEADNIELRLTPPTPDAMISDTSPVCSE